MSYSGYFNSTYVPSDAERIFIAQPAAYLGPNLISLAVTLLLQGILIVQVYHYVSRWWGTDTIYTKLHVLIVLSLSLTHSAILTASQWEIFVSWFGNWEALTHNSGLARSSTLSSTILSLSAQAFFLARVYHLDWRLEFLFIPLAFFFAGTLGTAIGQVAVTPAQLIGTAYPETFRRLDIVSAVFPLLLGTGTTACLLGYFSQNALPARGTFRTVVSFTLHSALPATLVSLFELTSAFEQPPFAFRPLTHAMVGYIQACCMVYSLASRTHPSSPETETAPRVTTDLRWTSRVPLLGTAPRLALLPVHRQDERRLGSEAESTPADRIAHARRVSDAESGRSISFMPPGLYDPRAFKGIYVEQGEEDAC